MPMRLRLTMCKIRPGVNSRAVENRLAKTSRDTKAASCNITDNLFIYYDINSLETTIFYISSGTNFVFLLFVNTVS